ncbi:MAG: glycerophosphodiester phosphodiesterase, partial [Ilumatobacteraceae bacterium]
MLIIGHRGASRAAPENTPDAFATADRMGADGVELDVRRSPDGRLVVFHDPLPADPGAVGVLPDLATVLDSCGERMLVNVEVKTNDEDAAEVVDPTVAELLTRGADVGDRWLVSSFSWAAIERCRAIAPSIPTAYLVMGLG